MPDSAADSKSSYMPSRHSEDKTLEYPNALGWSRGIWMMLKTS
jgi:hypothetical protein